MVGENRPGVELRAKLKYISHKCHLFEMTFVWELTKETIHLPVGCLQGTLYQVAHLLDTARGVVRGKEGSDPRQSIH